jgi:hypothetical protein
MTGERSLWLSETLRSHLWEIDSRPAIPIMEQKVLAGQLSLALKETSLGHCGLNLRRHWNPVARDVVCGRSARVMNNP